MKHPLFVFGNDYRASMETLVDFSPFLLYSLMRICPSLAGNMALLISFSFNGKLRTVFLLETLYALTVLLFCDHKEQLFLLIVSHSKVSSFVQIINGKVCLGKICIFSF